MTNIIYFLEAKNKQKYIRESCHKSLMTLSHNLRNTESTLHENVIIDFIESSKLDPERLVMFLKIINADKHLKATLKFVLKTMPHESLRRMIHKLAQYWQGNYDVIDKLNNMLRLAEFWARTSPKSDFFKVMSVETLIASLQTSLTAKTTRSVRGRTTPR